MSGTERVVPLSMDDLTRITADDEAVTAEFAHAGGVTVVSERNRRKWEEHDRPEDAGDVVYLSEDDARHIRLSKTGIVRDGVRLIREASTDAERGESDS